MKNESELILFRNKLLMIIAIAVAIYLLFLSRTVLSRLGIAIVIMVILDPLVKFFMKYMPKKSRMLAILTVFILGGLLLLLIVARFVPIVSDQWSQAVTQLNNAAAQAQKSGQSLSEALASNSPTSSINALLPYIAKAVPSIVSFLFSSISSLLSSLFAQLMVFGFVLFGLIEGPYVVNAIKKALPKKNKKEVVWYSHTLYHSITTYITGNLFISLCAGAAAFVFCLVLGIPYAGLMFLAVAICDLIPMFGSYLSGLVLGLFAYLFAGLDAAVAAGIFVLIYQQFENNILSPLVYKQSNKLTPLTVLVVVALGGAMFGLLGALLAIPVGSTIQAGIQKHLAKRDSLDIETVTKSLKEKSYV